MKILAWLFIGLVFSLILSSCGTLDGRSGEPRYDVVRVEKGVASWYSVKTNRGRKTASGRRFCEEEATAAHRTLPFGTKVRVTNLRNGQSAIVTITDRGPFKRGRIIDVTSSIAKEIGFYSRGLTPCKVEVLKLREDQKADWHYRSAGRNSSGR